MGGNPKIRLYHVITAVLIITAALAGLHLWNQWVTFGAPARTLEAMVSAGSEGEVMRCYSRRSLSMMRIIRGGRGPDCFQFSMLTGSTGIEIVSEERSGTETLLRVKTGDRPPYELRFVRELLGWKFDISDKLSAALRGMEK